MQNLCFKPPMTRSSAEEKCLSLTVVAASLAAINAASLHILAMSAPKKKTTKIIVSLTEWLSDLILNFIALFNFIPFSM